MKDIYTVDFYGTPVVFSTQDKATAFIEHVGESGLCSNLPYSKTTKVDALCELVEKKLRLWHVNMGVGDAEVYKRYVVDMEKLPDQGLIHSFGLVGERLWLCVYATNENEAFKAGSVLRDRLIAEGEWYRYPRRVLIKKSRRAEFVDKTAEYSRVFRKGDVVLCEKTGAEARVTRVSKNEIVFQNDVFEPGDTVVLRIDRDEYRRRVEGLDSSINRPDPELIIPCA